MPEPHPTLLSIPARKTLHLLGLAAAAVLLLVPILVSLGQAPVPAPVGLFLKTVVPASAIFLFAFSLPEVVAPKALVEVVHAGVRLRIGGLGRQFVLVPWNHLLEVRSARVQGMNALGFRIREDPAFQLPRFKAWSRGPGSGEPKCSVTLPDYLIPGTVGEWVEKLERLRQQHQGGK